VPVVLADTRGLAARIPFPVVLKMRRILAQEMVTVDGYFAGPDGSLDWFVWDDVLKDLSIGMLKNVDTLLFGRVTYEMMAAYWPTATEDDPAIKAAMNSLLKMVFSRTLEKADWNNTRLVRKVVPSEILQMKQQHGKDMVIYGSGSLVSELARQGLIDEYRLIVNPVVLGTGKPLFTGLTNRLSLTLLDAETLGSGNVLLRYQPASAP
jgi:dihydrofolate reductase